MNVALEDEMIFAVGADNISLKKSDSENANQSCNLITELNIYFKF